jgi:hypothetical protein
MGKIIQIKEDSVHNKDDKTWYTHLWESIYNISLYEHPQDILGLVLGKKKYGN